MEEKALFINIATLLAKDLGLDKNKSKRTLDTSTIDRFTEFLQEEDDGLDRFVYEMQNNFKKKKLFHQQNSKLKINLYKDLAAHEFESNLHIRRTSLVNLIQTLFPVLSCNNKFNHDTNTIISLGLWKLCTDEHFEEISRRFKLPLQECLKIIRFFWTTISQHKSTFVKWPVAPLDQNKLIEQFQTNRQLKRFKNLFALIMVKCLNIFLESLDEEVSVVLQIVCGPDQRIIDCYADLKMKYNFEKSPLARKLAEPHNKLLPAGCYLIGDQGCPLRRYLIRPFEKPQTPTELAANALIEKTRIITNSVLYKMTERFNSLYALEARDIDEVNRILDTIASIHNIFLDSNDDYIPESTITDESNTFILQGHDKEPEGRRRRLDIIKDVFKA